MTDHNGLFNPLSTTVAAPSISPIPQYHLLTQWEWEQIQNRLAELERYKMNDITDKPEVQDAIKRLPNCALELIEIAKRVEKEVLPDNFTTVFNGIVQIMVAEKR